MHICAINPPAAWFDASAGLISPLHGVTNSPSLRIKTAFIVYVQNHDFSIRVPNKFTLGRDAGGKEIPQTMR